MSFVDEERKVAEIPRSQTCVRKLRRRHSFNVRQIHVAGFAAERTSHRRNIIYAVSISALSLYGVIGHIIYPNVRVRYALSSVDKISLIISAETVSRRTYRNVSKSNAVCSIIFTSHEIGIIYIYGSGRNAFHRYFDIRVGDVNVTASVISYESGNIRIVIGSQELSHSGNLNIDIASRYRKRRNVADKSGNTSRAELRSFETEIFDPYYTVIDSCAQSVHSAARSSGKAAYLRCVLSSRVCVIVVLISSVIGKNYRRLYSYIALIDQTRNITEKSAVIRNAVRRHHILAFGIGKARLCVADVGVDNAVLNISAHNVHKSAVIPLNIGFIIYRRIYFDTEIPHRTAENTDRTRCYAVIEYHDVLYGIVSVITAERRI